MSSALSPESACGDTGVTDAMDAALRAHRAAHPAASPTLAEVAQALAAQDGSPLAEHPDLLDRAVGLTAPDADPDDVLACAAVLYRYRPGK